MDNSKITESLLLNTDTAMREIMRQAIQEAYAAGYLKGADDATQRIFDAAKTAIPHPPIAHRVIPTSLISGAKREAHPNSADARRFPYGAVTNAFRDALRVQGFFGVTKEELVRAASNMLGHDLIDTDHRDTFKRLKKAEEMRVENGRYFAGPKLDRNENGASATLPLNAPETGEAATSPIDDRATERSPG